MEAALLGRPVGSLAVPVGDLAAWMNLKQHSEDVLIFLQTVNCQTVKNRVDCGDCVVNLDQSLYCLSALWILIGGER